MAASTNQLTLVDFILNEGKRVSSTHQDRHVHMLNTGHVVEIHSAWGKFFPAIFAGTGFGCIDVVSVSSDGQLFSCVPHLTNLSQVRVGFSIPGRVFGGAMSLLN